MQGSSRRASVRRIWRDYSLQSASFLDNPTTSTVPQYTTGTPFNNMADTGLAPAQYKQPSRKGKKAWRKNVDVTQVQDGLEDVRDQIMLG
jgi:hypothetical protein